MGGMSKQKTLLGDKDLKKLLQSKAWKMGYVLAELPQFQRFNKGGNGQKKLFANSATIIKKEIVSEPAEKIVRANFTAQTDEEAFGPAFLYEEPEMFVEKREIPTNTNYMQYNQNQNKSIDEEDEEYPPNNIC